MKTLLKNFWKNVHRHYLSQCLAPAVKWPEYLFTFFHPYVYANLFHPFPHTSSSSIFSQKYFKHSGFRSRISCTSESSVKEPVSCTAVRVGVDALSPLEDPEGKNVTDILNQKKYNVIGGLTAQLCFALIFSFYLFLCSSVQIFEMAFNLVREH